MYNSRHAHPLEKLPPILRKTLGAIFFVTLFCLLMGHFFTKVLHLPSPTQLLSLSKWGIHHGFIWQLISYLFVQTVATGFSLDTLLSTAFQLYLIQWMGKTILDQQGRRHFIALFFGGALFVGIVAYLTMLTTPFPFVLLGSSYVVSILFMAWAFLFPSACILVFFILPVRAKWLAFGYIAFQLLSSFSSGDFFSFALHLAALCYGYFYPILVWDRVSPFPKLHNFENNVIYAKRRWLNRLHRKPARSHPKATVYSLETGDVIQQVEPQNDPTTEAEFVDACLEKISQQGLSSLTLKERLRLRRYQKKRKKE